MVEFELKIMKITPKIAKMSINLMFCASAWLTMIYMV